jgi:hypothetical protein
VHLHAATVDRILRLSAHEETEMSSEQSCPMIERQSGLHAGVAEWQTQRT